MWAWPLPISCCLPLLLYPTIAMSRIKSLFFNIESKVIKDNKSKLLFSRKKRKRKEDSRFGVILLQLIM